MNKKQKVSAAKYFYDLSKGIALLAVVGNMVRGEWRVITLIAGTIATIIFFLWGYYIEGGVEDG